MTLRALRNYRVQAEDALRMEVFRLRQALHDLEDRNRLLSNQVMQQADAYLAQARAGMTIEELMDWHAALEAQTAALEQAQREEARMRDEWSKKQAELVEARQERRKLELLEERREDERRQAFERLEQRQTDEAAHHMGATDTDGRFDRTGTEA